jgi:hypothetical protein
VLLVILPHFIKVFDAFPFPIQEACGQGRGLDLSRHFRRRHDDSAFSQRRQGPRRRVPHDRGRAQGSILQNSISTKIF